VTVRERITAAAQSPRVVVAAHGLLGAFNVAGVLDPLDVLSASTIGRLLDETDEVALLAAALTVRGTRFGHVCIRLDDIRDAVVVDGQDPETIDQLPWPTPEQWRSAIDASPLVGTATDDTPLIVEGDRLYLERYYRYEEQVATLIHRRLETGSPRFEGVGEEQGSPPFEGGGEGRARSRVALGGEQGSPPFEGGVPERSGGGEGLYHAEDHAAPASATDPTNTNLAPETRALLSRLLDPDGRGSRQLDAAVLALTSRIAVIAGGPGTGKTHTVATLLAALAASDGDFPLVALCAPTGKAAARLGQALAARSADLKDARVAERFASIEPSTIHRLLGWSWERGRFAHHAHNRLPHDLVIVDEMSMVSLPMAAKLLAAVDDGATVVLVGDPFQLESIEAGTVLADVVGPAVPGDGTAPPVAPVAGGVVVLERAYRFEEEGAIADFADAVRRGDADTAVAMLRADHEPLRWAEVRRNVEFRRMWEALVEQRSRMVRLAGDGDAAAALAALSEMAVLCARRRGPDGVAGWSRDLESALDEQFTGLRWKGEWYPGRPVMITRNDYQLELYNGDIGICVQTPHGLEVVFGGDALRRFAPSHLDEHSTVHAMTIHKSQGSQFAEVVVVLPDESSKLLTRELLYTAVTRAKQKVHLVGSEAVIRAAIERSVQRASGLGTRLWRMGVDLA
jgi:exodeoxyribonuclease V alpha subunit